MLRRSVVARSNLWARRVTVARPVRVQARFQSNISSSEKPSRGIGASHVIVGGLTVVAGGYVLYRAFRPSSRTRSVKGKENYRRPAYDKLLAEANKIMKQAIQIFSLLRGMASSFVQSFVEDFLGVINHLFEAHPDEMKSIRDEAADGLFQASQILPAAERGRIACAVIATAIHRAKELGGKAGYQILDNHPILKEKLGRSYKELQRLTLKGDLTWIKTLTEVTDQMKELTAKDKLDDCSIAQVRDFMEEKASILRSQIRAYESIYDFFGLELPDEYKEHIADAEHLTKGDVPAVLEGRVKDTKGVTERTSGESKK